MSRRFKLDSVILERIGFDSSLNSTSTNCAININLLLKTKCADIIININCITNEIDTYEISITLIKNNPLKNKYEFIACFFEIRLKFNINTKLVDE